MTAKNHQKHYNQNQKCFITSMFTHTQGICPDDRGFQCRRKHRHSADMHDSADIHRNNTDEMEYNTHLRKKTEI